MSSGKTARPSQPMLVCRRQGTRIPLPVEVRIHVADRVISGIVRDVTLDDARRDTAVGISLLHYEPLSINKEYRCRSVSEIELLPAEFTVAIRWCRYFEDEAYISGGVVQ